MPSPSPATLSAFGTITQAQTVETGVVKLADSNIEYFSRGKGEPIILLPGGTLTVGYLNDLAEAFAKPGYRVVGINFRGSSKSTGSGEGVTLQTMADDVAGVVSTLKLGPVHMAGNDFANRVVRMLATSHPELARSVILLAAGERFKPNWPPMRCRFSSTRRPPMLRFCRSCHISCPNRRMPPESGVC